MAAMLPSPTVAGALTLATATEVVTPSSIDMGSGCVVQVMGTVDPVLSRVKTQRTVCQSDWVKISSSHALT